MLDIAKKMFPLLSESQSASDLEKGYTTKYNEFRVSNEKEHVAYIKGVGTILNKKFDLKVSEPKSSNMERDLDIKDKFDPNVHDATVIIFTSESGNKMAMQMITSPIALRQYMEETDSTFPMFNFYKKSGDDWEYVESVEAKIDKAEIVISKYLK